MRRISYSCSVALKKREEHGRSEAMVRSGWLSGSRQSDPTLGALFA